MCGQAALEANNWEGPEQDDTDVLTEAEIDAIMAEAPESGQYSDAELEEMARDYEARHAA